MKKISILLLITFLAGCQNFDIEHPDFDYTSGYLPYQYPVRTLILGDYIYDNSNDNDHKFRISAAIGGVYQNNKERVFNIAVDNSLCENVLFEENGNSILPMPAHYYELTSDKITIPKGKFNGGIEVQLSEEFFDDPDAIKLSYVIPVRLTGSNDVDTILAGKPLIAGTNPDPRSTALWEIAPKNFTLFAVKFVNEFHGSYFYYGESRVEDMAAQVIEDSLYSNRYVEQNPTVKLITEGRNKVYLKTFLQSNVMQGVIEMMLLFDNAHCSISEIEGSPYTITGEGTFFQKKYEWGNKERDGIEISYTVSNGVYTYKASDVLIVRDRDIVMEVFNPIVIE